jgi:signal peptidase I
VRRLTTLLRRASLLLLIVGWAVLFRPQLLGGPATYLVVRGTSMLPAYETGDLVILQQLPAYAVGEVIGYRVPAGEIGAGRLVLHRIIGTTPSGFRVQGDNNEAADPWTPGPADVAGTLWIVIPAVGRILAWLHEPAVIGALATAFVVAATVTHEPRPGDASRPTAKTALPQPGSRNSTPAESRNRPSSTAVREGLV